MLFLSANQRRQSDKYYVYATGYSTTRPNSVSGNFANEGGDHVIRQASASMDHRALMPTASTHPATASAGAGGADTTYTLHNSGNIHVLVVILVAVLLFLAVALVTVSLVFVFYQCRKRGRMGGHERRAGRTLCCVYGGTQQQQQQRTGLLQ